MDAPTLYLRREPTLDRQYPHKPSAMDIQAYRDERLTERAGRWAWFYRRHSKPRRCDPTVTLNCMKWRAVWLPDLKA